MSYDQELINAGNAAYRAAQKEKAGLEAEIARLTAELSEARTTILGLRAQTTRLMTDPVAALTPEGQEPAAILRSNWSSFCDCDPIDIDRDEFTSKMEAAGLITWRAVEPKDLEQAFASELGIEPGGMIWVLTDAGRDALAAPPIPAEPKGEADADAPFDPDLIVAADVAEAMADGAGFWRSCSGCHESNEGYPTGPYSPALKCHLGGGCTECGGLGAIWDTTDYADMGDWLAREPVEDAPVQGEAGLDGEGGAA